MQRVRRPQNGSDGKEALAALKAALEAEGVRPGEVFQVTRDVDDPAPLSDPDEDARGPYVKDSPTSERAAYDNMPRSGTQRRRVLEAIFDSRTYGKTRDELAVTMPDSSVDPRVKELLTGGWIEESPRKRSTRTGSLASVLIMTAKGADAIAVERSQSTDGPSLWDKVVRTLPPPPETIDEGAAPSIFETR